MKIKTLENIKKALIIVMFASLIISGSIASVATGYLTAPKFKTLYIPAERRTAVIKVLDIENGAAYVDNGDYVYTDSRALESELTYFYSPYGISCDSIECRLPITQEIKVSFATDTLDPRIINEASYLSTLDNYNRVRDMFPIILSLSVLLGSSIAIISYLIQKFIGTYLYSAYQVARCAQVPDVSRALVKYLKSSLELYWLEGIHELYLNLDRFMIVFTFECALALAYITGMYTELRYTVFLLVCAGFLNFSIHPVSVRFGAKLQRKLAHFNRAVTSLFYALSIPERRSMIINHITINNN